MALCWGQAIGRSPQKARHQRRHKGRRCTMQEQGPNRSAGSLSAVDNAFAILSVLSMSDGTGLGLTEIAKKSGVPKATAHRILKALADIDVVYFTESDKKYGLGSTLLGIGLAALRQ